MVRKYFLSDLKNIKLDIQKGDIIFLHGDLASGKTTLSKHIIGNILWISDEVISPTYTYYNKYWKNIYHFDLYRLSNYDEFFAIWGEEILENSDNISLIEWPEIIGKYFSPTIEIFLRKTENEDEREIEIIRK